MIFFKTEDNLAALNSVLARYIQATGKLPDDVLEQKGRDLSIKLYQGFSAHKYGGSGKKKSGLAKADLARRTEDGEGTHVRASLLREYLGQRGELRDSIEAKTTFGPHTAGSQRAADRFELRGIKQRIKLWQSFVGREIAIRQRGIGILAASFLWFRSRTSSAGTHYVVNKTGRKLGFVEKGKDFLRIVGLTDGLDEVDARYGIVARAIADVTADIVTYVERKENELLRAAERFSA